MHLSASFQPRPHLGEEGSGPRISGFTAKTCLRTPEPKTCWQPLNAGSSTLRTLHMVTWMAPLVRSSQVVFPSGRAAMPRRLSPCSSPKSAFLREVLPRGSTNPSRLVVLQDRLPQLQHHPISCYRANITPSANKATSHHRWAACHRCEGGCSW